MYSLNIFISEKICLYNAENATKVLYFKDKRSGKEWIMNKKVLVGIVGVIGLLGIIGMILDKLKGDSKVD